MKLYAKDENGKTRRVKAAFKCIDGKFVKLKKGTPEYYAAIEESIRQGVVFLGS